MLKFVVSVSEKNPDPEQTALDNPQNHPNFDTASKQKTFTLLRKPQTNGFPKELV